MNPAPAISTLASAAFAGNAGHERLGEFARILPRRFRETHGDIAREIAVLRVARALHFEADVALGRRHQRIGQCASACRNNCSIRVFKANPRVVKGSAVYRGAQPQRPQSTSRGSTSIDQRKPVGPGRDSTTGSHCAEKALQRRPRSRSRSADALESDRLAARSRRVAGPEHAYRTVRERASASGCGAQESVQARALSFASARSSASRE